jgi:hypothetical protein
LTADLAPERRQRRPQRPPAGLSRWARGVWTRLLADNEFSDSELITFARALKWWDLSDKLLAEAATAGSGQAQAQLTKLSLDAATSALRHWKTLKFTDASKPARRPGRPSGDGWSPARAEGARLHRLSLEGRADAAR